MAGSTWPLRNALAHCGQTLKEEAEKRIEETKEKKEQSKTEEEEEDEEENDKVDKEEDCDRDNEKISYTKNFTPRVNKHRFF